VTLRQTTLAGHARVSASAGTGGAAGTTVLTELSSGGPLVLRRTGVRGPVATVHLVGGAAGPLGGDHWRLDITVGPDAVLRLRSVAATLALPGAGGAASSMEIHVEVAPGGRLDFAPEPLVAVTGARHRSVARIRIAAGGGLVWREEIVAGRSGEPSGGVATSWYVEHDGKPLLAQDLAIGPEAIGWSSAAVLGDARAIGTMLFAGTCVTQAPAPGPIEPMGTTTSAVAALAGPGILITAFGPDPGAVSRFLDAATSPHSTTKQDVNSL
jgi:urease accessory protein